MFTCKVQVKLTVTYAKVFRFWTLPPVPLPPTPPGVPPLDPLSSHHWQLLGLPLTVALVENNGSLPPHLRPSHREIEISSNPDTCTNTSYVLLTHHIHITYHADDSIRRLLTTNIVYIPLQQPVCWSMIAFVEMIFPYLRHTILIPPFNIERIYNTTQYKTSSLFRMTEHYT